MATEKDFMLTDDMVLDDVEDMPTFDCWPTGLYRVILNEGVQEDEINEDPYFKIPMTLKEVVHQETESEENLPKPGSEMSVLCNRANKFGAATWKVFAKAIQSTDDTLKTVREINEASKGFEAVVMLEKVKQRKKKGEKEAEDRWFPRVKEVLAA